MGLPIQGRVPPSGQGLPIASKSQHGGPELPIPGRVPLAEKTVAGQKLSELQPPEAVLPSSHRAQTKWTTWPLKSEPSIKQVQSLRISERHRSTAAAMGLPIAPRRASA